MGEVNQSNMKEHPPLENRKKLILILLLFKKKLKKINPYCFYLISESLKG